MCSIVEEDFGDDGGAHAMVEDPKSNGADGGICKKCNSESAVARLMCGGCLLVNIRHKFRATLGSTKVVRRHSRVLMDFNGTAASICLLDMVKFAFEQESYKRLCFDMELVFIDEDCVGKHGQDVLKRNERIQEVKSVLEQFPNFKCFYTSIGGTIDRELPLIEQVSTEDVADVIAKEAKFLDMFNSLQSLSSRQDLLAIKRNDLLRHAAAVTKCQYVFLSDISITLATRLLTNMSLGRGSSVANDVAFCDDRIESIKFVRPIKDLCEEEVVTYLELEKLNFLTCSNHGDDHGQFASIQNLTSKFINDLQQNFSSTVSTVYRTCSKIAPAQTAPAAIEEVPQNFIRDLTIPNMNQRCVICKSFLDYQNSETLFAINFSRYVSKCAGDQLESKEPTDEHVTGSAKGTKNLLCHGCRNIFIDQSDDAVTMMLEANF